MHLQQTKRGSRVSGGPQYYFHDLTDPVKESLRKRAAVKVALMTPYGATPSNYFAVSKDCKFNKKLEIEEGRVGHDRIQQGRAEKSIGESIRKWYRLQRGDFERIDIQIDILDDVFYLTPTKYKYADDDSHYQISLVDRPLTFTIDHISSFWSQQISDFSKRNPGLAQWCIKEICRIAQDHRKGSKLPHIQETDLLRAAGPLNHFGMVLGGYVGKGYDCLSNFTFLDYPTYNVPVELKRYSHGFQYQQKKYGRDLLSRAVVLCAVHDHKSVPDNIDIIELDAMCKLGMKFVS